MGRPSPQSGENKPSAMRLTTALSIRDKLIVLMVATAVLTLLVGFGAVIWVDVNTFRADLVAGTQAAAGIVAEYSVSELAFSDARSAEGTLAKLQSLPGLELAVLYDRDGQLFASFGGDGADEPELPFTHAGFIMSGDSLHVVQPVVAGGETYGTLYLCSSTQPLRDKITGYLRTILLVMAGLVLLSTLTAAKLQGLISGPILRLADAARQVSQTGDYSVRLTREGEDEVGVLYDAWNEMLDQVETRRLERATAEEALRRSEERFRNIIEQSSDAIYVVNLEERFLYVNPKFVEVLEVSSSEVLDPKFDNLDLLAPESRTELEMMRRRRASGETIPERYTFRCVTRAGRTYDFEVNATLIDWDGQPARLGILRDFTRRVEVEEQLQEHSDQLQRYAAELERSNRELDQFAYVVSHDLRAPLRAISNLSTWIEADLDEHMPAETRGHLELLRRRAQRLENLITGILDYSRVGRVKTKVEEVDVGEVVQGVIDDLAPPLGFTLTVDEDLPVLIAERVLLEQVFGNLIGNAIKHHPRQDGRIRVGFRADDDGDQFSVGDDGDGIAAEYHDRIFTIFQTLQPRDKHESTGVGLAIVKKIVDEQGGRLWVESAVGEGATFFFTWPMLPSQIGAEVEAVQ